MEKSEAKRESKPIHPIEIPRNAWKKDQLPPPASPTDAVMSPVSQSLLGRKQHVFKAVAKPKAPSGFVSPTTLVLGSESKIRHRLLSHFGFDFVVKPSRIDEKAIRHENPSLLVTHLAMAKGKAIAAQLQSAQEPDRADPKATLILTADQVVVTDGKEIMEKPRSEAECKEFIARYSGGTVETVCGLTVTHAESGKQLCGATIATIHFKMLPEATMSSLASDPVVRSCAGGLCIEHAELRPYIARVEGSVDGVLGLDVTEAVRLLRVFHGNSLIPPRSEFSLAWHDLPYLEESPLSEAESKDEAP